MVGFLLFFSPMNCRSYNCSQSEEEEKIAPLGTDLETKVNTLQFPLFDHPPPAPYSFSAHFLCQCFAVRSLGWVEMSEEDMAPGKSSVAVNNCIRQLSYHKHNLHDTAGIWGEVRVCCLSHSLEGLNGKKTDWMLRYTMRVCLCYERAKICWWSWKTTRWTWSTHWARICFTLSPSAAFVFGAWAETMAGQCLSLHADE